MVCRLAPGVKLRGYLLVPHAFYLESSYSAGGLTDEEFDLAAKCDGQTELTESPLLDSLIQRNIVETCEKGGRNEKYQNYRFSMNRYFPSAKISITGRCSFKCKHCFNAADTEQITAELSKDEIFDILAQLDECGVHRLEITGGEPVLHPTFMDIMREISRRRFNLTELNTTAHYFTEEMADEFKALKLDPCFHLSFDGIGYHDWFRGVPGAEETLYEKVKMLTGKGFSVHLETNVNGQNTETILPTMLKCNEMGAGDMQIQRTYETPRPVSLGLPFLSQREYYDFALKTIEQYIQTDAEMPVKFWQFIGVYPKQKMFWFATFASDPGEYRDSLPLCRSIRGKLQIDHNGNFMPCLFMSGAFSAADISFGNFRENKLRDIMTDSKLMDTLCVTADKLREHNPDCRDCEYWKACTGGCRCLGILYSELGYRSGKIDYLAHDPTKCLFFKEYYKPALALFKRHGYTCANDLTGLPTV